MASTTLFVHCIVTQLWLTPFPATTWTGEEVDGAPARAHAPGPAPFLRAVLPRRRATLMRVTPGQPHGHADRSHLGASGCASPAAASQRLSAATCSRAVGAAVWLCRRRGLGRPQHRGRPQLRVPLGRPRDHRPGVEPVLADVVSECGRPPATADGHAEDRARALAPRPARRRSGPCIGRPHAPCQRAVRLLEVPRPDCQRL